MQCEICNGRKWVVEADGGAGIARRCPCWTDRPIEQKLAEAGVGADLLHASWETWLGPKPDFGAFPEKSASLCLLGITGTGKSHAAVAIMREWLLAGKRCRFAEAPDLLAKVKALFGTEESAEGLIQDYLKPDLLVLDEAYANQATPWADETISRIIRGRMRQARAIITTSNLSIDEVRLIEPRIASRIEGALVHEFTGRDMRPLLKRRA